MENILKDNEANYYKKIVETSNLWHSSRPEIERQAEIQLVTNIYKGLDDFIEREARRHVITDVYSGGFNYLTKIKYGLEEGKIRPSDSHLSFIKTELHEPILKRMEEMRKELIKEYKFPPYKLYKFMVNRMEDMQQMLLKKYDDEKVKNMK